MEKQDKIDIMREPIEEEIWRLMWGMHPLKSLGSDCYLGVFYKTYWTKVKKQVVSTVQECFCVGSIQIA